MIPFEVRRRDEPDLCLVAVHGEVDLATAPELRDELRAVLDDEPAAVVLDLDGVPFLDSTGLGVLVAAYKRAIALGIPLRIARPKRIVANALSLARIDTVVPVHDTVEDAVAQVRSPSAAG